VSSSPTSGNLLEVTMPQMGVSVAEGTIVGWKKQPGDTVEADEPIVEISTDKVETEVPAPGGGVLKEVLVEVGETVDVGTVLATIEPAAVAAAGPDVTEPASATREERPSAGGDGGAPERGDGHAPPVTPVVRRMAEEHDLDLSQIEGSGRRGRVTKRDVLAYLRGREQRAPEEAAPEPALHMESPYREEEPTAAAAPEPVAEAAPPAPGGRELSVMRKRIAEHMVRSLRTAAHCTTIVEADMSRIEAARGRRSYLPFVARATIAALRDHPELNATLEGELLTVHDEVHLGIAVSLGEQGLIVPVIRDAQELSHEGLATRIKDLAERARSKRLSPDEVGGGTFTITNPGAYGAVLATPIINQPQVAILDLEAVVKRPVVVTDADGRDSIAIRPMTFLCMSWDHRALDGALAAQFLSTLKRRIEDWQG
jgi:pyruvate/2-oxoglutarate dehydrogenase complex dihydrolipoamide acyltransferase (E2) component